MANNSADYWKLRFEQLEHSQNLQGHSCYIDIEKQYRQAEKQLEGQIASWYQRFANNNNITIQEARQMLTSKELEEFKWDVNQYIKYGEENAINGAWEKQLENASVRYHINRLEALKIHTQQSLEVMFGNQLDSIDTAMRNIYKAGYYGTAFELQKGLGVGWNFATLDDKTISKVINKPWAADGKNFSERIWSNRQRLVNELNTTLTQNIILGQDPQKAIDAIAKKMNTSKNVTGRLVMTEEAFFSSAAQKDCFNELDVEQYEILATLDTHTSNICRSMDSRHFPMSQWEVGVTAPPFHVWCRSTTIPFFDDEFDNVGERAARGADGKTYYVPADMTYKEWEKAFVDGDKSGLQEINFNDTLKAGVSNVDKCKTVEEVENLMKKQNWFNVQIINEVTCDTNKVIDLSKCDLEAAKQIYKSHEQVFEKYPQLIGKLNSVNSALLGKDTYAQCMMGFGNGGINVNERYFKDYTILEKLYNRDLQSGYHPKGTDWTAIITHELGHAIDDYLTNSLKLGGELRGKPRYVSSVLRPKVMSKCNLSVQRSDIKEAVSEYAAKDAKEWFAECFAEYMKSGNPRDVAKEFGSQLEELLKEVK
ncbi:MAG: minor capsid protein [Lachnospiraceae bacterium]